MTRACRLCGTPWRFEPGFPAGAAWRFKCPDGERCAQHATVRDLASLDLSDPCAPTPGDALALRGGVLAGERWRPLADGFASAVDAAREATP